MKTHSRVAVCGTLLGLLLTGALVAEGMAANFALGSSSQIPAAQGKVNLSSTKNGNVKIKLSVKHLAPPGNIIPGASVFVVWARGLAQGSEAQNLGAMKVDKNLNGKLTAATAMSAFDLFLTCEQSQTSAFPSAPELLPLHYMGK
jgi:hypothetical protein